MDAYLALRNLSGRHVFLGLYSQIFDSPKPLPAGRLVPLDTTTEEADARVGIGGLEQRVYLPGLARSRNRKPFAAIIMTARVPRRSIEGGKN